MRDPQLRKRVGFLSSADTLWGAEHSLLTLVRELKHSEVEPVLVAYRGALTEIWQNEAIGPVVAIPDRAPGRARRNIEVLRACRTVDRCRTWVLFNFDLLPMAAPMRALRPRDRVYLDLHDHLPGRRGQLMLRGLARTTSGVVSVSRFVAGQVGTGVRQTVIHRPIAAGDTGRRPAAAGTGQVTVGVVGRIDPEKEHRVAIRAVAGLDRTDLLVRGAMAYGQEAYVAELRTVGTALLGERWRLEGPAPQAAALDGIDVLVVGNRAEPLGRTVAEAQLRGIPTIVPETGGAAEMVRHRETGLTYVPGDAESLAARIRLLTTDHDLRRSIVGRAAEEAAVRHEPGAYARAYLDFLRMGSA